jgi:protein-disulfide isomerase
MTRALERIIDLATAIGALSTAVIAVIFVIQWLTTRAMVTDDSPAITIMGWQSYAEAGHRLGSENPSVTVVEFADFQCPACALAQPHLEAVLRQFPDNVAVVYRHFPATGHRYAEPAARAAECAAEQGRFWHLHNRLFGTNEWMIPDPEDAFVLIAREADVPEEGTFRACLRRSEPFHGLTADFAAAWRLGLSATPSFLVNDRLYVGVIDSLSLVSMVEAILESSGG